jgi:hypothetical protein
MLRPFKGSLFPSVTEDSHDKFFEGRRSFDRRLPHSGVRTIVERPSCRICICRRLDPDFGIFRSRNRAAYAHSRITHTGQRQSSVHDQQDCFWSWHR